MRNRLDDVAAPQVPSRVASEFTKATTSHCLQLTVQSERSLHGFVDNDERIFFNVGENMVAFVD